QRLLEPAAGLFLAAPEQEVLAKLDLLGAARQRLGRHHRRLDLRLLPFVVVGILAEQHFGHDQPEYRVAEELERLVVGHAAARILRGARLVRQGVLEQAAIPETVADADLQLLELVSQPDDARADVFAVAGDDALGILPDILGHGDADVAQRVHRHWPDRLGIAGDPEAADPVAVEQRGDHRGFDVGSRGEDDAGGRHYSTRTSTQVMSSCCAWAPAKTSTSRSIRSRN